jgi:hypothetical protein
MILLKWLDDQLVGGSNVLSRGNPEALGERFQAHGGAAADFFTATGRADRSEDCWCRSRRKVGPFWRVKRSHRVGYAMAFGWPEELAGNGRLLLRVFLCGFDFSDLLSQPGAIGFARDLQNDGSLDQPIQEGHCQRTVGEISSHFSKSTLVTTAVERFLVACGDHLVEQMSGFEACLANS